MKWDNPDKSSHDLQKAVIKPGQAEKYEKIINQDGTVDYKFTLRDNLKWSDGRPIIANDFVYTWRRALDPKTGSTSVYIFDMIKNEQEIVNGKLDKEQLGVKALDDKTFVVTLNYDCPYFIQVCCMIATMPVRKDVIESNGDTWSSNPDTLVCNGAFKLTEWVHNSYIMVEKNENYYDHDKIKLDGIKFVLMDDANSALASYKNNDLDYTQKLPVNEIVELKKDKEFFVQKSLGTYHICFQTQKPPFDNPLVRKAFSLAINREYITKNITRAEQAPAAGYIPIGFIDCDGNDFRLSGKKYFATSQKDYKADCIEAKKLLAQAGYENGKNFPTVEYTYNTNDEHKAVAEALQNMWQDVLGVKVTLSNQDWNTFLMTLKDGNYQLGRLTWCAGFTDPIILLENYLSDGANNKPKYLNKDYDNLIKQIKNMRDDKKRFELMHQAEDIIMNDSVVAPIYFYTTPCMLKSNITGAYYTTIGNCLFMYCDKN
jgi:oligopeptide transport system substrate-binding protein